MTPRVPNDHAFFGHPRGLSTLFFTEMWERFSYYGMRALLLLYMTAPLSAGGLGFDAAQGGAIYGLYTSMVYMACLPGTRHGARERSHDAVEDGVLRFGPRPHPITGTISRISGLPGQHKEGSQTQRP